MPKTPEEKMRPEQPLGEMDGYLFIQQMSPCTPFPLFPYGQQLCLRPVLALLL